MLDQGGTVLRQSYSQSLEVTLTRDEKDQLAALARKQGASMREVIRSLIRNAAKPPKGGGAGKQE